MSYTVYCHWVVLELTFFISLKMRLCSLNECCPYTCRDMIWWNRIKGCCWKTELGQLMTTEPVKAGHTTQPPLWPLVEHVDRTVQLSDFTGFYVWRCKCLTLHLFLCILLYTDSVFCTLVWISHHAKYIVQTLGFGTEINRGQNIWPPSLRWFTWFFLMKRTKILKDEKLI